LSSGSSIFDAREVWGKGRCPRQSTATTQYVRRLRQHQRDSQPCKNELDNGGSKGWGGDKALRPWDVTTAEISQANSTSEIFRDSVKARVDRVYRYK
jgi:hypothetical protein